MKFEQLANKQIGVSDDGVDIGIMGYSHQYNEWRFSTIYMNAFTSKQLKKVSKKLRELNNV